YAEFSDENPRRSRLAAYDLDKKEKVSLKDTGEASELRDFASLSLSAGGIAFTTGAYGGWKIGTIGLGEGSVNWPEIALKTDRRDAGMQLSSFNSPDEFAVSPNGKLVAFTAGGDVYLMPTAAGGVAKCLGETLGREKDLEFSPDSQHLLYATEDKGVFNLYLHNIADDSRRQLTNSDSGAVGGRFFPDGKRVLYIEGEKALVDVDLEGKAGDLRVRGNFHGAARRGGQMFEISPKARWVTYVGDDELGNSVVLLADLANKGEVKTITRLFGDSYSPTFSADAKRLAFVSNETDDYDVYVVELQRAGVSFAEDKLEDAFKKPEPAKKEEPKKDESKKEEQTPEVEAIDFDNLQERIRRITTMSGSEMSPAFLEDSSTVYFLGSSGSSRNIFSAK
ncbi:MAG: PD40 domain-containing protein, partial [Planctomycetes bacterium]|nr:PD40 domain-containing protein [Planctomycetota bacterium]